MGFNSFTNKKGDIAIDTSSCNTKESPSVLESRHAPFLLFALAANNLSFSLVRKFLLASSLLGEDANT